MRTTFAMGCAALLLSACEAEPDMLETAVSTIETAIGVAAPVGRAVSAAMAVEGGWIASGGPSECSRVVANTCGRAWPCEARVELRVDEHCPLPLADDAHGTVTVDIRFEGPGAGVVVAGFADVRRSDGLLVVEAEAVNATWIPGGAIGEYASARVRVADSRPRLIEGAAWSVTVVDGGTPHDPRDDSYLVVGGQGAVKDSALAVTVDGVVVDQGCTANPVAGTTHASLLGDGEGASLALDFHADCDGRADIVGALGLDIDLGATIDLDFGR